MATVKNVKIGIMSFAHMHAYSYAHAVKQVPGAELSAIADDDSARGRNAAKQFDAPFLPGYKELLESDVDAVIICSENSAHADLTVAAAAAGKHVLVEKPISTTIADAHRMIAACRDAGVKLHVAFPVRYQPAVARVKRMLADGAIGRVIAIKGTNHGRMPGGWFIDRAKAGGGAVMDHTVHVVDLMRWFLGKEVTEVYAEIGTLLHKDIDIDDAGLLTMELEGGVFATLDTSWSRPKSFPTWGDVTMEIMGTGGVIYLDAFAQASAVYSDVSPDGPGVTWDYWGSDMDYGLVADFIEAVRNDAPTKVTGYDGLQAMAVALAAYRSAEMKRPVKLSEIS